MNNKKKIYVLIIIICLILDFLLVLLFPSMRAKPVIYLYPENETEINVMFAKPELLTTTYPKFNSSWKVNVKPNGDMYDENGRYYYALYYEANGSKLNHFEEGFYVEKDDAIDFLEEKLSILGLNERESNEFIMYWLPVLEQNEKSLVYFETTESLQKKNKLIINPKPDSLLRINIHIKKVNKKVSIKEQELPRFERKGFSAVEWGGIKY